MSQNTWAWNPLAESPEQSAKNRSLDEQFARLWETSDMWKASKWAREAMWGIWAVDPESGSEIAKNALSEEENDSDSLPEDELDSMLSKLDGWAENTPNTETADIAQEQNPESAETHRRIEEGIHTPLIQTLRESGRITPEGESLMLEHFADGGDIDGVSQIEWIDIGEAENVQDFLHYTNTESAAEQATEHFESDFWDAFESFKTDNNTFRSERAEETYNMIASQYFLLGEEWSETTQEVRENAMNTAILTALNMEIDGKNFPRNESFERLSGAIRNPENSPEDRFQAFIDLRALVDTTQGRWGKKQTEAFRNMKQRWTEALAAERMFFESRDHSKETQGDNNPLSPEDAWQTIDETPSSWDVFEGAWVLDTWSEASETTQESA